MVKWGNWEEWETLFQRMQKTFHKINNGEHQSG